MTPIEALRELVEATAAYQAWVFSKAGSPLKYKDAHDRWERAWANAIATLAHPVAQEAQAQKTYFDNLTKRNVIAVQRLLRDTEQLDEFLSLFCNAVDNLSDMPITEAWAEQWARRADKVCDMMWPAPKEQP